MIHHPSWMGFSRTAVAIAVAFVAAAPALAQNTTSALSGRVLGADGKPVAGVTVTIVHVESGSTNTATTDSDGRYIARALRAGGPFTVTFSKGGVSDKQDEIFLQLAQVATLDGQLGTSSGNISTIVVTGRGINDRFNRSNMGAATSLGSRELSALPSVQRNLQDYARSDPRVAQTDKDRGEISALGQNTRFNSITIDGVNTNDPFGLEANNLPTSKQPISMDAIQAVQINVSNYDVSQKGYTGANINAVTKSGTNEFKGSVYYVFRDEALAGERFSRATGTYFAPANFKETTAGITMGGPVIKDRLFFFAAYEQLKSSRAAPVFGPLGSSLANVGITQEQIAQVQQTARTVYNFDAGSFDVPASANLIVTDALLKLDWNISDSHRASVRYSKTEETNPIFPANSGTVLSLNSHWYTQAKTNQSVVGQWFADWSDNFNTELKVSQRTYQSNPLNNSNLPQVSLVFTGPPPAGTTGATRTLIFGTEQFRHFNRIDTKTLDSYLGANWVLGNHELKFGADYQTNDIFNAFVNNSKGVYEFRGVDPVALFAAGVPSNYTLRVPVGGLSINDGAADWTLNNLGVFLQDTWKLNPALTVMAGVRMDRTMSDDRPRPNPAFKAAFGLDNTQSIDGQQLVQPRLGFNLNLTPANGRRMQLRGGVGLFEGAASNVWLTNPFQNTGVQNASFTCGAGQVACSAGLRFTPDTANQPAISGTLPASAPRMLRTASIT